MVDAGSTSRRGTGAAAGLVGRQVDGDRHQVGVGLGGVRRLEPLVELVEVDAALPRGLAQDLRDLVAVSSETRSWAGSA